MRLSAGSSAALSTALSAAALIAAVGLSACDTSDPEPALFTIRACENSNVSPGGETFQVRITDPDVIAEAERLVGSEDQRIVTGPLVRGDGGFNAPWSWHLDPDSVTFADVTVEVCDGCPHMVEEDLDYWVDTVGRFCPWSTEVVERVE